MMVVGMGLALFVSRLRKVHLWCRSSAGAHAHQAAHLHGHEEHYLHLHLPPRASGSEVTWRSLLALGVSGGLLPCPSAVVVMLGAIALDRVGFGLLLVLALSLGLAGTLTAIGLLFVGANNGFMTTLDLATGQTVRRFYAGGPIKGTAALVNGALAFTSWSGLLHSIHAPTGKLLFETQLGAKSQSSPTWVPGLDYWIVGSNNGIVSAIDARSGRVAWVLRTNLERLIGSALVLTSQLNSRVLISCGASELCLVDPRTGSVLDRLDLGGPLTGVPVFHDGAIYLSADDPGGLMRIDLDRTTAHVPQLPPSRPQRASPPR
jgi:hypothetical protein